jgi:hypothetical protein
MNATLDDIRAWLAEHMPSLSRETVGMTDSRCRAHLCEYVGMEDAEPMNLRVLHRKLKQSHFGG